MGLRCEFADGRFSGRNSPVIEPSPNDGHTPIRRVDSLDEIRLAVGVIAAAVAEGVFSGPRSADRSEIVRSRVVNETKDRNHANDRDTDDDPEDCADVHGRPEHRTKLTTLQAILDSHD